MRKSVLGPVHPKVVYFHRCETGFILLYSPVIRGIVLLVWTESESEKKPLKRSPVHLTYVGLLWGSVV